MQFCSLCVYLLQSVSYHKLIASEVVPDSSYYTPCPPPKRPTLSFVVTLTWLHQNGQNLAHKKKKLRATKRT